MTKYEEKFIVINKKHLEIAKEEIPDKISEFIELLGFISNWMPDNKYYVCNQDEPYAGKVINIILTGEDAKAEDVSENKEK